MSAAAEGLARILVIDSNVFFAKRLVDALRNEQFEVIHATQAAYALTMLEWSPPAVILCSTNLRGIGAYDLPKLVHADKATAHIPILAMGEGDRQALMMAFRAGCDDYMDRRVRPGERCRACARLPAQPRRRFSADADAAHFGNRYSRAIFRTSICRASSRCSDIRGRPACSTSMPARLTALFTCCRRRRDACRGRRTASAMRPSSISSRPVTGSIKGLTSLFPEALASTRTVLRSVTELMLEALREIDEEREQQQEEGGILL